jgi:tRNA threonylcarbamoyladenosine biosynthesis protein TsaE
MAPAADRPGGPHEARPERGRARVVASSGPDETEALGAQIARELAPGAVVVLSGDVGAGKTTLVRGAVRELGHGGRVTSPTFTLVNRYEDGRVPISHLDLYRLAETGGLAAEDPALVAEEIGPRRIAFVEWPEAADHASLGAVALRVTLRHAGGDARDIEVERLSPSAEPRP